jgi:hypothetical protein
MALGSVGTLSFLDSVNNFYAAFQPSTPVTSESAPTALERASNTAKTIAANYAQPFIPGSGLLRNIYQWYDGHPQETYNNLAAKLANKIPVAREYVGAPVALNRFGEEVQPTFWTRNPMGTIFSRTTEDPVSSWLEKSGHTLSNQGPTVKMNSKETAAFGDVREAEGKYKDLLNEKESYNVLKISGPQIKSFLQSIMYEPAFAVRTDKSQKIISDSVSKIRAAAKMQVLR